MKRSELEQKLAQLESVNDQLMTEVSYVDRLMRLLGFAQGLHSVKVAAQEIIKKGIQPQDVSQAGDPVDDEQDGDLV